jgi:hypothetical protein
MEVFFVNNLSYSNMTLSGGKRRAALRLRSTLSTAYSGATRDGRLKSFHAPSEDMSVLEFNPPLRKYPIEPDHHQDQNQSQETGVAQSA